MKSSEISASHPPNTVTVTKWVRTGCPAKLARIQQTWKKLLEIPTHRPENNIIKFSKHQIMRMNIRMPKITLSNKSNWRRRLGRPLKRLLIEAKIGLLRPNSYDDDDDDFIQPTECGVHC
jgi:hypothetical protein